ncbi:TonB-linked outer membrane protein, SusC/RagA family [Catalinimonas alkaloidigena]|uniref:TonB-linked outer membrane protein, SusC/RagA family n=1 Tax=Catalinimonas alkaloidigena TaxID=1075417 RepID=A0A1G9PD97_9BACT|nr:SusC/RagA family TonB-linked outer membrane protein [Catalinimonas alkaloidigena]SDL96750.1 TonB-linked outer membrane protein, SusC/RagA family [Catalinimonas alkaloidigena]
MRKHFYCWLNAGALFALLYASSDGASAQQLVSLQRYASVQEPTREEQVKWRALPEVLNELKAEYGVYFVIGSDFSTKRVTLRKPYQGGLEAQIDKINQQTGIRIRQLDQHNYLVYSPPSTLTNTMLPTKTAEVPMMSSNEIVSLQHHRLHALDKQISGRIIDTAGEGIPGVNILEKGTSNGTITDVEGRYTLTVGDNATLIISAVGYLAQEVAVGNQTSIDLTLEEDVKALEEVVVVGYGTQEKRDLTSAVVTVTSKNFVPGAVNSPLQFLDGKVAGVTISNPAAGDPNRGTDIQVRGAASIEGGTGPLIIIDGLPGGSLSNVAQQDIESISVLKDGSAAAIYGSRAANGVVIVTTKKGASGRVNVGYNSYIEHDGVARRPDVLSPEEFLARGRDVDQGYRTDWYDALLNKNNFGQNHNLSISGGNDKTLLRLSGTYRTKSGIDLISDREEYNVRLNFNQKAFDDVVEFYGNLANTQVQQTYISGGDHRDYGAFQQALKLNPTLPIMDPNNPTRYAFFQGYDTYNPVHRLMGEEKSGENKYLIADFNVRVNLLKNLNTEVKIAQQNRNEYNREFYPSTAQESIQSNRRGRARLQNEEWIDRTFQWVGNYMLIKGAHDLKLLGGYLYQDFVNRGFYAENMDFASDAFTYNNLDAGLFLREGQANMDSWKEKEKLIGFFGRVNYDFNDTYLLTASLRREGSTKFGDNNKWGWFPAISAGWRIAKYLPESPAINDLKLRAGYGVTGRQGFPRYRSQATYTNFGAYLNESGSWIRVYGPNENPNPNLRWEKAINYNVGVDFTLFNSRVSGSLDVFIRDSKDMISNYDAPKPPMVNDQIYVNVGKMRNQGLEGNITWNVIQGSRFNYTTTGVVSYVKSKVVSFSNEDFGRGYIDRYSLPSPGNPGPAQRLEEGVEIGSFYGLRYAGVDDQGRILIYGADGEKKLSTLKTEEDRAYIGNGNPKWDISWNNRFSYGAFDLSLYFRSRLNYDILNLYQMYYGLQSQPGVNLLRDAYDRNGHILAEKEMMDYFLEPGGYLRLDNASLGWTPTIKSKYVSSLRVYGTVRNVFTITKFTGLDPTTINAQGLEPGIADLNVYPVVRNFSLGVQANF